MMETPMTVVSLGLHHMTALQSCLMRPTILELRHTLVYTHNNTLIHETIHYYHPMLTTVIEVWLVSDFWQ